MEETLVRKLDTAEYMKIVRSLLEEGREVPLVVAGNSMIPFLADQRDKILIERVDRPLKRGDIAFFQRRNGQYIMHRICRVRRDKDTGRWQYWFVGDAQTIVEGPIEREQIFGLITEVERKGRNIRENSALWFFFRTAWLWVRPFRRWIMSAYEVVKKFCLFLRKIGR